MWFIETFITSADFTWAQVQLWDLHAGWRGSWRNLAFFWCTGSICVKQHFCFRDPLPDTYPVFSGDNSSDWPCCCDSCDSSVTPCFPQPGSELSLQHFMCLWGVGFPGFFPPQSQPESLSCSVVLSPTSPRQIVDWVSFSLAISPWLCWLHMHL